MAKKSVNDLKQLEKDRFDQHWNVMSLWQTLAEHFYPERADFTMTRNVGQELADNLLDSYPILMRRDLANSFSAMLRDDNWFEMGAEEEPDYDGNVWLDWGTKRMRKLMEDRSANFVRATKEGDNDYATFGNAVLSVEMNARHTGLLYRCWHLRDCAWWDGVDGHVEGVIRKWKPTYHDAVRYFPKAKLTKIRDEMSDNKNHFKQADFRHFFMPSEIYDTDINSEQYPFVSVWLDIKNDEIIEEIPMTYMMYVVPRFQTIAGSPYAYSTATVVGLPDARCLQAMTHTLMEAGERYARPPIIATQKMVRGDVDLSPDGITWVDDEYDERMGAAMRTLQQDRGGFPIGMEMRQNVVQTLSSAFYLNKITLPDMGREMTAYEVAERMKQYRRENLPLFAPIEAEYNGQLCETSFQVAMANGLMGSPYDIPESLRGREVRFKFESPLTESEEQKKSTLFSMVGQMVAEAAQYDQGVIRNVNFDTALRDAVEGTGSPTAWLNSLESVLEGREQDAQKQEMAEQAQLAQAAGDAAQSVGAADAQ